MGSQVTRAIYDGKTYEPEVTRAFVDLVKPGMVFVDVGAQFGYYTLMAAKRVGRNGKVVAFEPKKWVRHILSANIHINFYDNVEIFPYALFSESGRLPIIDYGSMIITDRCQLQTQKELEEVEVVAFDSIIDSIKLTRINIVKIDIEGAELGCLEGMAKSISQWEPVLFIEVHPSKLPNFGHTCNDLFQFIKDINYNFYVLNGKDSIVAKAINGERIAPFHIVCRPSKEGT